MNEHVFSRSQCQQVDKLAVEQYGMSSLVLMENAGRGCVDLLERLAIDGPVAVCCGKGNNAGDGFVIARHLDIRGYQAKVLVWSSPDQLSDDAAANYHILSKSEAPIVSLADSDGADRLNEELVGVVWIVDALLGTGVQGAPRPPFDRVIEQLNKSSARRLAVDVPSGLDCDTGEAAGAAFRADHTATFVAIKQGYRSAAAKEFVGQTHVLDIGAPRKLVEQIAQTN